MLSCVSVLAVTVPNWVSEYIVWWIAGVIVVGGLLIFGREELWRLRFRRVWAISSVVSAESVRRKVLWVTPLAILGVLAVSLLQHALDPQEAIRQTIKFCLFASGLLVTVTAIILACTNLPREIENRVIYTIVTKPTTRLEIVLGKVLGFVRVSGLIILIMGVFTFVYLELQNHRFRQEIAERLAGEKDPSTRQILLGYQTAGLLSTKSLDEPVSLQIFEHPPAANGKQMLTGGQGYFFVVPFELDGQERALLEEAAAKPEQSDVLVISTMHLERRVPTKDDLQWIRDRKLPMEGAVQGPGLNDQARPIPQISIHFVDDKLHALVPSNMFDSGKLISPAGPPTGQGVFTLATAIPAEAVRKLLTAPRFFIEVVPETPSVVYEVTATPTVLYVQNASGGHVVAQHMIKASGPPQFLSKANRYGLQIVGDPKGEGSIAVFQFRNAHVPSNRDTADFRFRAGIERSGTYDASKPWSIVTLQVINNQTHETSGPIEFHPETNQDFPVPVPAKYLAGGNFDVYVRGMDAGQWIGFNQVSVQFISADQPFALNLVKSLLILWLMSSLVVIIAIFTSTFLSWPIAVVLTLLILLGHWGVGQLGESLNPGVGRSVATDLGFRQATQTEVVSRSIDALATLLRAVSAVLPDVSRFPVMDNITRGVSIPARHILDPLAVLVCYGLPMLVLSFVILKNKEVAP